MSPDMKITQVKSNGKSLKNIELPDVMTAIRSGEQARVVNEHRGILSSSMPGDRNIHATDIPVLLFAARFRKKESRIEYQAYNGLVLMDVGNLADREEAVEVKRLASLAPQTMAAFVGSSGKSVKILVPFVLPDGSLPEKRELAELFHAVAYRRAVAFYQAHLQRHIEMGEEASLERGCRHSFDPGLYYNPSATPLIQEQPMQMPAEPTYREVVAKEEDPLLRMMPGYDRSRIVSRFYNACMLDALEKTGGLDEGKEVRPFLTRLAENCFRSGIPEEDVVRWTKISRNLELFEEEIRETVHMVYQLSKCFGKKPVMPAEQLLSIKTDEFMKRRYEFRRNMLAGEVEFRARGSYYIHFAPVTETVLSIGLNAQAEGLALWDRDVKRYVYSDRVPVFYPLEDYLEYLPEWDGKDHIRALADTLPTANAQWRNLFYIWFLSMTAHWYRREHLHANSSLPLLVGPQGCGKSTWCRNLLPPSLRMYYTDSIDFSNKRDAELMLTRFALINIDEFDSVSSAYQSFLKNVLQKPVVNARQPYKRSIQALHRYASFIVTCNNYDLLTDPTGSRRFICIEISGTIDNSTSINYEQLYAQAVAALKNGERYWFTSEEEFSTTRNNEVFQQLPVEEQLFLQYFRAARPGEESLELSAIEILQYLQSESGIKLGNKRLTYFGRLLQKNKIPSRRTMKGTCYSVVKVG